MELDTESHREFYRYTMDKEPDNDVIIYGLSERSTTITPSVTPVQVVESSWVKLIRLFCCESTNLSDNEPYLPEVKTTRTITFSPDTKKYNGSRKQIRRAARAFIIETQNGTRNSDIEETENKRHCKLTRGIPTKKKNGQRRRQPELPVRSGPHEDTSSSESLVQKGKEPPRNNFEVFEQIYSINYIDDSNDFEFAEHRRLKPLSPSNQMAFKLSTPSTSRHHTSESSHSEHSYSDQCVETTISADVHVSANTYDASNFDDFDY